MLHVLEALLTCFLLHEDSSEKYCFMTSWDSGPQTSVSKLVGKTMHFARGEGYLGLEPKHVPRSPLTSPYQIHGHRIAKWWCSRSYSHCGSHTFFIVLTSFAVVELCMVWEDKGLSIFASVSRDSSSLPSVHQITNQRAASHGEPQAKVSGGSPWDVLALVFLRVCN